MAKPSPKPVKSHVQAKHMQGARAANKAYGPGPVTVYTPNPRLARGTKAAIRRTNTQTGVQVFRYVNKKSNADVVVSYNPGIKTGAARARMGIDTTSGRGRVKVAKGIPTLGRKEQAGTLQHELGHTIGLGHPGPAKNPYLFRTKNGVPGYMNHKSGIMGSGNRMTNSEVKEVRTLRAVANRDHHQVASKMAGQMGRASRYRLS